MKVVNIIGEKFGRLTVKERVGIKGKSSLWLCQCDCGNYKEVTLQNLRQGTKLCGCLTKEISSERGKKSNIGIRSTKHGKFGTKLYNVWSGMKRRCYNCNSNYYKEYGGRGIIVCDEWKNGFQNFYNWSINNGYKDGLSIDRINTNGNYEPSNCRWATWKEQQNNRRNNIRIEYMGKKYTFAELSKILGIKERTLRGRYEKGWSDKQITDTIIHKNQFK